MVKLNQRGGLLVPLIIISGLLVGSLAFGFWAYAGRQDYKNNADAKVTEAVASAEEALAAKKDAEFAEQSKSPYATFQGPAAYGTLKIAHPKTWSVYVNEKDNSSQPLDGFMHPGYVPAGNEVNFALRFQVVGQSYDQVLKSFDSSVRQGRVQAAAYRLPQVSSALGTKLQGEIISKKQGVLVVLPLRDKTVKIWTEGSEYRGDFDKILQEFTFIP